MATVAFVMLTVAHMVPAQTTTMKAEVPPSRVQIYGGYGYLNPMGSGIAGHDYPAIENYNVTAGLSYFFSHHFGVQVEGSYFSNNSTKYGVVCATDAGGVYRCQQDQNFRSIEGGLIYRGAWGRWVPYAHILAGVQSQDGPVVNPTNSGPGTTGGIGIDYVIPHTDNILAIRPIQADYQYAHVNYGALVLPAGVSGGSANINAVKLSGGIVIRLGAMQPPAPDTLSCSATPAAIYPGDLVMVQDTATGLNMKHPATYTWTTSGGKLAEMSSANSGTSVATVGLAPGDYKVSGHVQQGRHPYEQADCMAAFTVKPYDPPTIACSASPSSAIVGADVTLTATAMSPQNRSLTYAYTSPNGPVVGTGSSAVVGTTGYTVGTAQFGCSVTDDQGQTVTAQAMVSLEAPAAVAAAAPMPAQQALCTISFERDAKRPARVDNEAKACLDDIALTLNRKVDASLVIVGTAPGDAGHNLAGERAMNAKRYFVDEKGIDPARIVVRREDTPDNSAKNILLPLGATLDDVLVLEFDTHSVKQHGEAYGHHKQKQ